MATLTLFVSPDYIKKATILGKTIDDDILSPAILSAQERYILPILGSKLYRKMLNDIESDSLTGVYLTLVNTKIVPSLTQYAVAEVIPHLRVRLANNSATTASSENSAAVAMADLQPLIHRATELGDFHRERLIDYLDYNSGDYPEYNTTSYPDLQPTRRNYSQGLNIDPNYDLQDEIIIRQLLGLRR